MKKRLGKNDGILLGTIFLVLAVGAVWFYFFGGEKGIVAEVTIDGQHYGTYSLKEDRDVKIIIGEKVTNILRIHNGEADMTEADCPDQLCVRQRAVSKQKQTIVCLPNRAVVEVIGGEDAELDSIT